MVKINQQQVSGDLALSRRIHFQKTTSLRYFWRQNYHRSRVKDYVNRFSNSVDLTGQPYQISSHLVNYSKVGKALCTRNNVSPTHLFEIPPPLEVVYRAPSTAKDNSKRTEWLDVQATMLCQYTNSLKNTIPSVRGQILQS